jgi:hypothetical protein
MENMIMSDTLDKFAENIYRNARRFIPRMKTLDESISKEKWIEIVKVYESGDLAGAQSLILDGLETGGSMTTGLIYIGRGGFWIGVPARDLTEEEVKTLSKEFDIDKLIASGLYKRPENEPAPRRTKAQKEEGE